MADKMIVTIQLSKEVPDRETARAVFDLVVEKLSDRPDIKVQGYCSNHFILEEE